MVKAKSAPIAREPIAQKRGRILTLDLMRGLFLLIIFADHLAFAPSLPFQYFTHSSAAFASAAEGFFVISGILVGYIYGPKIVKSFWQCLKKIWKRALLLYGLAVIFTLLYTIWAHLLPAGHLRVVPLEAPMFDVLIQTLSLQYQFGWADFLARYAVFMIFAPFIIWLVAKRFSWLVIISSIAIWLIWREHYFIQVFTAWQLLFTFGIVIGHYLPQLESFVKKISLIPRLALWWVFVGGLIVSYCAAIVWMNITTIDWSPPGIPVAYLPYFDKNSLAIGRLFVGVAWFIGLYLIFRRFEQQIDRATGGFLLVFGQNSLFVYSLQSIVIFSLDVFFPASPTSPIFLNTCIYISSTLLVYLVVRLRAQILEHTKNFVTFLRNKATSHPL